MGRYCAACGDWEGRAQYSLNQWQKGDGLSRCKHCVSFGRNKSCSCPTCGRTFYGNSCDNQLKMHQQTHAPRMVACPICGEVRFRSATNAVQHVESGSCSGCLGKDNARRQIYDFTSRSAPSMLAPMLEWHSADRSGVPERPYMCTHCHRTFRAMGDMMQHMAASHPAARSMQLQLGF